MVLNRFLKCCRVLDTMQVMLYSWWCAVVWCGVVCGGVDLPCVVLCCVTVCDLCKWWIVISCWKLLDVLHVLSYCLIWNVLLFGGT